jgi:hypothetical protein
VVIKCGADLDRAMEMLFGLIVATEPAIHAAETAVYPRLPFPVTEPFRRQQRHALQVRPVVPLADPFPVPGQDESESPPMQIEVGGDGHAYNALENRLFVDEPANRSLSVVELLRCYRR